MKNDIYGEPEIITRKNIIARIYSPILTEKEKERRMDSIKKASVSLVLSWEENKRKSSRQMELRRNSDGNPMEVGRILS